ncbi:hypothetical protein SCARD494_01762 [Seiridium cardinale]
MQGIMNLNRWRDRPGRATWLWRTEEVVASKSEIDRFTKFAEENRITTVYVHINPTLSQADFEQFHTSCDHAQVDVKALMGDPGWVRDSQHESSQSRLKWIQDYQENYKLLQLKGLHLDIEPWRLEDWEVNRETYIEHWQSLIRTLRKWTSDSARSMALTADLPFWLHTLNTADGTQLDVAICKLLDGATFMTYRNTPEALMAIAEPALETAQNVYGRQLKQTYLAIETTRCDEGSHVSYYCMGRGKVKGDLELIEKAVSKGNGISHWNGGIAIHDYHGWSSMDH